MNEAISLSNDSEKKKSSKRNPENIGLVAVEPKSERSQQPHDSNPAHEHIGHILVNGEAKPAGRSSKTAPETHKPKTGKRFETLSRAELLSLSEKITVDGSNLRQIYETHLIGERGLRRLVAEYTRGGDLKKALRREIVEREIDFERDPAMRDLAPQDVDIPLSGSGGTAALNTLLEKAAVAVNDGAEEAAFFKARARYEATERQHQLKQRRLIDVTLTTVIALLIILVIFLLLRG